MEVAEEYIRNKEVQTSSSKLDARKENKRSSLSYAENAQNQEPWIKKFKRCGYI